MAIPEDWLIGPISQAEAEDEFNGEILADLWVERWWRFLDRLDPGMELWEYGGAEYEPREPESADVEPEWHSGFALVRGGEILESIEGPWIG